jgi:citronellyl-CoA dehydrogenase
MVETDIARAWRDVRALPIAGGTAEIMKEIIAKLVGL